MDRELLEKRVKNILEQVRPYLQQDGGDVNFIELTDDMSSEETIIANLDSDLLYDSNGTSYTREEVEEE